MSIGSSTKESRRVDRASPAYKESLKTALKWDEEKQQVYLQLPSYPNLRVIPYKAGIEDGLVRLFNCPEVGKQLFSMPYPFPRSFAETKLTERLEEESQLLPPLITYIKSNNLISSTNQIKPPSTPAPSGIPLLGLPCRSLIDTERDGLIVGDCKLAPHDNKFDAEEEWITPEKMKTFKPEQQAWDFGYVLDPDYFGQGIMGEMVACIIEFWIHPWMGIGAVGAYCDSKNPASPALLQRNGFEIVGKYDSNWPKEKGGGAKVTIQLSRKLR